MTALDETKQAQAKLRDFHRAAGDPRCSFDVYRTEIGTLLGIEDAVLVSLRRMGLIMATTDCVWLAF